MKAITSRLRLSPILLIGCLLVLPIAAPHARASEAKQHGSAKDMPPGLREAVSAAREREARSIYAADSTGFGAVAYEYRIAKHEVTDAQYAEFLNKVDAAGTNPNAVYSTIMGSDASSEISFDAGATGVGGRPAEAEKSEDAVPEGLTDGDWNSIRQEYERHRHAAVAVDGEFRARNPGQQWLTHFDGRGFAVEPEAAGWRWGLELQSYGFPGHQRAVSGQAKMTAHNDRVTYDWHAGLREWFVNDRRGLEHGFTLRSRPPGAGDPQLGAGDRLELRLAVRGMNRFRPCRRVTLAPSTQKRQNEAPC